MVTFFRMIGFIIFIAACGFLYINYPPLKKTWTWNLAIPAERISILVEEDFKKLQNQNALPKEWQQISKVTYNIQSPTMAALMGSIRPNLIWNQSLPSRQTVYEAEIEIIDLPDESKPGFILQTSLLNLENKNKIFELGRTYYLSDLNKKKPD